MSENGGETPTGAGKGAARGFGFRRASLRSPSEALQPETPPPPPDARPPKKKRRTSSLSSLSGLLTFLLVAGVAVIAALSVGKKRFEEPGPLAADKIVLIARGAETTDIFDQLQREGVISSATLFNAGISAARKRGEIKAGEYLFKARVSMRDVMNTLVEGKSILHAITIPEGLTSEQIVARLRESDILAGDVREMPKEGTLYPDTYRVPRGMARDQLIAQMRRKQDEMLKEIWARRSPDVPVRSPTELVTLASIVEKETGKSDERPRVAGVFVNRLQKRMRLQSDPTIVYGLVGGKGTLGRGILRAEITQPTPYNTYVIEGLPPGPIANPGRAAMEAAANPARTRDLYFVADGSGGHAFAETLDEHNQNVQRWRQIERDAKDRLAPDAAAPDPAVQPPAPGGRPQQRPPGRRGAVEGDAFGDLPRDFAAAPAPAAPAPAVAPPPAAMAFAGLAPRRGWSGVELSGLRSSPLPAREATAGASPYELGPGVETIPIAGITSSAGILGAEDDPEFVVPGDVATYPVSQARRADLAARAAQYGLPAADGPPPSALAETPSRLAAYAPQAAAPGALRPRVIDASEGTPLDPLRNRTFDLNSPKTIPDLRVRR